VWLSARTPERNRISAMRRRTTGTRPTVPSSALVMRPRKTWIICGSEPLAGVTTVTQS
jgi:hypothetical protein